MTLKEANERIAQLEAEKKARTPRLSLKVSTKGGLSVYGLGRFPVTLYREQWERLLGLNGDIRDFISANTSQLTTKGA